jgi:hypothetical protein
VWKVERFEKARLKKQGFGKTGFEKKVRKNYEQLIPDVREARR